MTWTNAAPSLVWEESDDWRAAQAAIARGPGADEVRIELQLQELDAAIAGTTPDELSVLRSLVGGDVNR